MQKLIEIYLIVLAGVALICGMSAYSLAQAPRYDLLLKGGHVIDPANNLDGIMDVAVSKDKIAAVEKDIPASQAGKIVDASGLYVEPALDLMALQGSLTAQVHCNQVKAAAAQRHSSGFERLSTYCCNQEGGANR